jgi:excisionase family DNA binding protein
MTEEVFRTQVVDALKVIAEQLTGIRDRLNQSVGSLATTAPSSCDSPFLTAAEAAKYLRRGNMKAFYCAIVNERIPHRREGRHYLFLRAELEQWLAQHAYFQPDARQRTSHGLTDADLTANQETVENNLLRFTCERAALADMTPMAFVEAEIFPKLEDDDQREAYVLMLLNAARRQLGNRSKE